MSFILATAVGILIVGFPLLLTFCVLWDIADPRGTGSADVRRKAHVTHGTDRSRRVLNGKKRPKGRRIWSKSGRRPKYSESRRS